MPRTVYEYERILTPVSDQRTLRAEGYTPFFSSNVSAGQRDGSDLYIRFHNGSVYIYPNKGSRFNDLLVSPSKGKWVWKNLRKANVSYSKVGSFPLTGDRDLTDEEMFTEISKTTTPIQITLLDSFLSTLLPKEELFLQGIFADNIASYIKGY
jgi:hypothetical protein